MGAEVGSEFLVFDSGYAQTPRVGVDAEGRSYFVFTNIQPSPNVVQWISYDAQETALTAVANLSTTTSIQEAPDIAVRADGSFYAIWRSDEDAGGQLRGRYYDVDGGFDPSDALVNDLPDPVINGLETGGVAVLEAGGFVAVWESNQTHLVGEDVDNTEIQGQFVSDEGAVAGSNQFQVNLLTTHLWQGLPDVAPVSDGGFFAVWEDYKTTGYEIKGRRFEADGTPVGAEIQIDTTTTGGQHDARVAANDKGEFLVVWTTGEVPVRIRGRMYDANVVPVGDDFLISSRTDVKQQKPDVGGGVKQFVVAWEREEEDWDILARIVKGRNSFDGSAFQVNTYDPPKSRHQEVGVGTYGNRAIVTWKGRFSESSGINSIGARTIYFCGIFCDGFEGGEP